MRPVARYSLASYPQSHVHLLGVCIQNVLYHLGVTAAGHTGDNVGTLACLIIVVAVAKLEHALVGHAVSAVACYALKATEQQALAQYAQVLGKGIEQAHTVLFLVGLLGTAGIVGNLLQAVVQYLVETAAHQLLCYEVLQLVALVCLALDGQA